MHWAPPGLIEFQPSPDSNALGSALAKWIPALTTACIPGLRDCTCKVDEGYTDRESGSSSASAS